jgi:hypothetical protein
MKVNVRCDKCGSTKVYKTEVDPTPQSPPSMKEYMNRPKFPTMPAVIRYRRYTLTCLDCGYRVTYDEK